MPLHRRKQFEQNDVRHTHGRVIGQDLFQMGDHQVEALLRERIAQRPHIGVQAAHVARVEHLGQQLDALAAQVVQLKQFGELGDGHDVAARQILNGTVAVQVVQHDQELGARAVRHIDARVKRAAAGAVA